MPAVSQTQRSYLYATKGAAWVHAHHFDNPGKLPEHAQHPHARKGMGKKGK